MTEEKKDVILEATMCQPAALGLAWTLQFSQNYIAFTFQQSKERDWQPLSVDMFLLHSSRKPWAGQGKFISEKNPRFPGTWWIEGSSVRLSTFPSPPFVNIFFGLFTRWMPKINPHAFGNVPSGLPGYVWLRMLMCSTCERLKKIKKIKKDDFFSHVHVFSPPAAARTKTQQLMTLSNVTLAFPYWHLQSPYFHFYIWTRHYSQCPMWKARMD